MADSINTTPDNAPTPPKAWQIARDQHFALGIVLETVEAVNEQLGTPCAGWTALQCQTFSEQFEYLINRLREHNRALGDALNHCEPKEVQ